MVDVLEVENLRAGYGKMVVLHGVEINVGGKEIVAVIGPNGAGKTTLLNAIFGLATLHSGTIRYRGVVLNGLKPHEIVRLGVGYAPQLDNVFPNLTVEENLLVGAYIRGKDPGVRADIEDVLELFPEIKRRRHQKAKFLSGGERQMLAVARALMSKPSLLLLDEPTAGLSPKAGTALIKKIKEIQETRGVSVLLVEQNVERALEIAERAAVLVGGRIVKQAAPGELKGVPLERVFFGGE
uniref:ABC transporter ATP-binding protein n=1 Tax=Thermofilum pendens TaxID=2269 RepID=A0A7C4B9C3_THEPE